MTTTSILKRKVTFKGMVYTPLVNLNSRSSGIHQYFSAPSVALLKKDSKIFVNKANPQETEKSNTKLNLFAKE